MTMENQTKTDNQQIILMELAIEKALQLSPYAGAACVAINGEGTLIGSVAGYVRDNYTFVEALLGQTNPAAASVLFLTQEVMAPQPSLEKLADLVAAKRLTEVCICNEAPGSMAGVFGAMLKRRGIIVSVGIAAAKLRDQKAVMARFYERGRPFVCCVLAMDDDGSPLGLEAFTGQFGFATQFGSLLNRFPFCVRDAAAAELSTLPKTAGASAASGSRIEGVIDLLSVAETAVTELFSLCRQEDAAAVLLVTTGANLQASAMNAAVDELVVYQMNVRQRDLETVEVDIPRLLPGDTWERADRSPLGDGIYFRYTKR